MLERPEQPHTLEGLAELADVVASRVGFASRSHFSKAFTAQFGRSPSAFRTQADVG